MSDWWVLGFQKDKIQNYRLHFHPLALNYNIVLQKRRSTVLRCLASTSGFNEYQDCDNFFTGKGCLQNVKNLFKEAGKEWSYTKFKGKFCPGWLASCVFVMISDEINHSNTVGWGQLPQEEPIGFLWASFWQIYSFDHLSVFVGPLRPLWVVHGTKYYWEHLIILDLTAAHCTSIWTYGMFIPCLVRSFGCRKGSGVHAYPQRRSSSRIDHGWIRKFDRVTRHKY